MRTQPNARIHGVATVAVVAAGVAFRLSGHEWCRIIAAILLVWIAEGMNTALELLADALSPDHHPLIGRAKDVAAGAVLLAAVGATVIGLITFGPHVAARAPAG